jgi:hypothetical protein
MYLYILDDNFKRIDIVEEFQSLIWTERYNSMGEMVLEIDPQFRPKIVEGSRFVIDESNRVMVVTTIEKSVDDEGADKLTVKGTDLISILDDRPNINTFTAGGGALTNPFSKTGTPAAILVALTHEICVTTPIVADRIARMQFGLISDSVNHIPLPSASVTLSLPIGSLYGSIKAICDTYNMGFRLIMIPQVGEMVFYVEYYYGSDRTTYQTSWPAVVFSAALDNLSGTRELRSTADLKTVAYVFSPNGNEIVYQQGYDAATVDLDRRVLLVDCNDIDTAAGATLTQQLNQRGAEALAPFRGLIGFDGQIPIVGSYVYGKDYELGDLVEQQEPDGVSTILRVTEQIFVSDAQGDRSYPTLTADSIVTPGSWSAENSSITWATVGEEYWADA